MSSGGTEIVLVLIILIAGAAAAFFILQDDKKEKKDGDECKPKKAERDTNAKNYNYKDSKCVVKTCNTGYTLTNGKCVKKKADDAKAKKKADEAKVAAAVAAKKKDDEAKAKQAVDDAKLYAGYSILRGYKYKDDFKRNGTIVSYTNIEKECVRPCTDAGSGCYAVVVNDTDKICYQISNNAAGTDKILTDKEYLIQKKDTAGSDYLSFMLGRGNEEWYDEKYRVSRPMAKDWKMNVNTKAINNYRTVMYDPNTGKCVHVRNNGPHELVPCQAQSLTAGWAYQKYNKMISLELVDDNLKPNGELWELFGDNGDMADDNDANWETQFTKPQFNNGDWCLADPRDVGYPCIGYASGKTELGGAKKTGDTVKLELIGFDYDYDKEEFIELKFENKRVAMIPWRKFLDEDYYGFKVKLKVDDVIIPKYVSIYFFRNGKWDTFGTAMDTDDNIITTCLKNSKDVDISGFVVRESNTPRPDICKGPTFLAAAAGGVRAAAAAVARES